MIKAPRGHTSVYLSDYVKSNFTTLHKVMIDRGFRSLNSFVNVLLSDAMNSHTTVNEANKPNILGDPLGIFQEKISTLDDDILYEIFEIVSDKRNMMYKELKNRGVGL